MHLINVIVKIVVRLREKTKQFGPNIKIYSSLKSGKLMQSYIVVLLMKDLSFICGAHAIFVYYVRVSN